MAAFNQPGFSAQLRRMADGLRQTARARSRERTLAALPPALPQTGTLIILPQGAGDYLLARTYLADLLKHPWPEPLCWLGWAPLKGLMQDLDPGIAAQTHWVDDAQLLANADYAKREAQTLRAKGYHTVISLLHTRLADFDDFLMRAAGGNNTFARKATTTNPPAHLPRPRNAYSHLLPAAQGLIHESEHYREMVSWLTGKDLPLRKPTLLEALQSATGIELPESAVCIVPGARMAYRQWPLAQFVRLIELFKKSGHKVVLVGGPADKALCEELATLSATQSVAGKLSWGQTAALFSICRLVICGDTGPLHLAVAAGAPAVCISNGNHWGRFVPYPAQLSLPLRVVGPPELQAHLAQGGSTASLYQRSWLDIRKVPVEHVWQAANELLNS
jgi:ADP-heptose:LPS heptosyltransferase